MYSTICGPRLDEMSKDVGLIKEKVFNGLSGMPKKMNLLVILFVTILAGIGTLIWSGARNQGKLEGMIQTHMEMSAEAIREAVKEASE